MKTTKLFLALVVSTGLTFPLAVGGCAGSRGKANSADVQPGNMPSGARWEGVYYNPIWGFLHIQQQGTGFNGAWKRADESAVGQMHGSVTGDIARFEWEEHKTGLVGPAAKSHGKGYFRYVRPEGDNVDDNLVGQWGFDEAEIGGGDWNCIKQRNLKPDLKSIKGEVDPTVGGWK